MIKLFAKILYTGGAPTLVDTTVLNAGTSPVTVNESQGFVDPLTNNGGGTFTLTLGNSNGGVPEYDTYVRLLNVSGSAVFPSGTPTQGFVSLAVVADNVNGSSGNPSIQLTTLCVDGTGVVSPAIPDNGTILYVELTLSNTTAY